VLVSRTSDERMVTVPEAGQMSGLDRYFKISERGSSIRIEVMAGITTWLTMAYILFVNPLILGLGGSGLPFAQVLTVTALAAGAMTLAMGIVGKYPFAIAAGLGLNAFVAFTLVGADGLTFPQAMGVIVAEGILITLLVLTNVRELVINAIPMDLKRAIGIGIGAFIAFIGLVEAGVVHGVTPEGTPPPPPVGMGSWTSWPVGVFAFGLILSGARVARKVRGALLIGIVSSTVVATIINEAKHLSVWSDGIAAIPHKVVATPDFALVGDFSFSFFSKLGFWTAVAVVVSVMLSDFFDTVGSVIGIGGEAGMLDAEGRLPGMKRVLLVDSLAAVAGGVTSSSSNTTYIESASGVSDGGRTGLTAVTVGVLFLIAMFFSPIAGIIPKEATAPALVIVGYFMMTLAKDIEWSDPGIGIPVLLTVVMMPFTYSITNGIGAGFVSYSLIALLRGKGKDVHALMWIVSAIFVWYFVHGAV
jgi:AGZA family xanthine/uracil permease-like MFS transporter